MMPGDDRFDAAAAAWAKAFPVPLRLVLHAGTQKTGTSALQETLFRNVAELAGRGIWYPPARVDPHKKKHQFLVDHLLAGNRSAMVQAFDEIVASAPSNTRTIVLSSEGLFNHWWDYPPASKAMLRRLGTAFALEVWVCFREPLAFASTHYAQVLRNPRVHAPAYGLDAGLDEMLENDWFVKRFDYLGFVLELEHLVGERNVRLFRYGPDIVRRIFRALGADEPETVPSVHPSMRVSGAELMRVVNRYHLPADEQAAAEALVLQLDRIIGERAERVGASPAARSRVAEITAAGWSEIEARLARDEARG